jgi:hypothetical protein
MVVDRLSVQVPLELRGMAAHDGSGALKELRLVGNPLGSGTSFNTQILLESIDAQWNRKFRVSAHVL